MCTVEDPPATRSTRTTSTPGRALSAPVTWLTQLWQFSPETENV